MARDTDKTGREDGTDRAPQDVAAGAVNRSFLAASGKLDLERIMEGLDKYRPRRRGWSWRRPVPDQRLGPFTFRQTSAGLKSGQPLPAAKFFGDINPQPECTLTSEIASGRFEDDLRRMRMAVYHGADHIMVIRTAGQSHFDGLFEGTPEGVGGVPVSRKQLRATRKALDLMEDEVGRPINLHSYVSGVAGPEVAVLFAEEGVNGAHQDPQYNVLYRNINAVRSFVDAAEAKKVMNWAEIVQIDGAHNANATAREAWKVMPELLVQHAINCAYSVGVGMPQERICLSTVPPDAPPAPALRLDLPYAVALRELFAGYRMRAQMNTKYIESDTREATVTHTLNILLSRLTSADIQSTITPDEGRNVPWHYNSIRAVETAKQALLGLDGIQDMVTIKRDGLLGERVRELKERAVLFLEEIMAAGGYFEAVSRGFFVDSGCYPERHGDGIARDIKGGVGYEVVPRAPDYFAPVCSHFGENHLPAEYKGLVAEYANPLLPEETMVLAEPLLPEETTILAEPHTSENRTDTRTTDPFVPKQYHGNGQTAIVPTGNYRHGPRTSVVCQPVGGCTLCHPDKIRFIDEIEEDDTVDQRLAASRPFRTQVLSPEVEWAGDGIVSMTLFLPTAERTAHFAALEIARQMGWQQPEVIHKQVMHPAEGTLVEVKGEFQVRIDPNTLKIPPEEERLSAEAIRQRVAAQPLHVVAATVGEDEHSVGLREILDIKHGGIEAYGITFHYLGTSVPVSKVVDAALETGAGGILISTIITHGEVHRLNMQRLHQLCIERGVRQDLILIAGGTQITNEIAQACGLDAGFGRGTKGIDVASFLVKAREQRSRSELHSDAVQSTASPPGDAEDSAGRPADPGSKRRLK